MKKLGVSAISTIWEFVGSCRAWMYRTGILRTRRLRAPVISVGNITFGGTGKTPFTMWIADRLMEHGYRVAILTRGYRRRSKGIRTILPAEKAWAADSMGAESDEVQLYRSHLPAASIGIAAARFDAGDRLEQETQVDVHILDDGFQHLSLARSCDVVLIDATDPWGSNYGLPRALREPLSALGRANVLVVTRCEQADPAALSALETRLRTINREALLIHARTTLLGFRRNVQALEAPDSFAGRRAVAVCGLGHPENFFTMLRTAGISLAATRVFPDHHRYNDQDLDQINELLRVHSAECLITTEKDVANLPHAHRFADHFVRPAYWAEIDLALSCEAQFLHLLEQKIAPVRDLSGRH